MPRFTDFYASLYGGDSVVPTGLGYVEAILDELTAHGMQRATGQCPGRDSG